MKSKTANLAGVEEKKAPRQITDHDPRKVPFKLTQGQNEYISALMGVPVMPGTVLHSHPVAAIERHTAVEIVLKLAYEHAAVRTTDKTIVDIGAHPARWKLSHKAGLEIAAHVNLVRIHGLCPVMQPNDSFRGGRVEGEICYCECSFQDYVSRKCPHAGCKGPFGMMRQPPHDAHTFLSIHSLYYLPLQQVFEFIWSQSRGGVTSVSMFAVLHRFVGSSGVLCNGDLHWWRDDTNPSMVTVQVGTTTVVDRHSHDDLATLFDNLGLGIPYKEGCICLHMDGVIGDTYCIQIRFALVKPQRALIPVVYQSGSVASIMGVTTLYNIPINDLVVRSDQRHAYLANGKNTVAMPANFVARAIDHCRYKARTAQLFSDVTRAVTRMVADSYVDQGARNLITLHLPVVGFLAELPSEIEQLERAQLSSLTRLRNRIVAYLDYLSGENYTIAYHSALLSWKSQPNYTPIAVGIISTFMAVLYAVKRVYGLRPVAALDIASATSRIADAARAQIPVLGDLFARFRATPAFVGTSALFTKCTDLVQTLVGDASNRFLLGLTRQARVLTLATLEEVLKRCFRPQFSLAFGIFEAFGGNLIDVAYHAIMHYLLRLMPFPVAIAFHTLHNLVHNTLSLSKMHWICLGLGLVVAWFLHRRRSRQAADANVVAQVEETYRQYRTGTDIPAEFVTGSLNLPSTSFDPQPMDWEEIKRASAPSPSFSPTSPSHPMNQPPRSALSCAATGLVHVEKLTLSDQSYVGPEEKLALRSEFATPKILPVVPSSDTNTMLAATPRVKTRATTEQDHALVRSAPFGSFGIKPSAFVTDPNAPSSSFSDWSSYAPEEISWGVPRQKSSRWTVVPSAVVYEPASRAIKPQKPTWSGYAEFAAAFQISHDIIVGAGDFSYPCYNVVCIARGGYHTRADCPEPFRVQLPSAPASLLSGWYWYSCDNHFMCACMEMVSSFVANDANLVRAPFSPYTYAASMRAVLPHIAYPRVDASDILYDRWTVRYTRSKRAALDKAKQLMDSGGHIDYITRCFVKREKLLWATETPPSKPPRIINGTSASYNVRFGPFFHAVGELLHEERGPCHMLLEGDYSAIPAAFRKGVDYKIFTTGDDCMIIIRGRDSKFWVIMLDANRFDGTQNSRVFVLKLLFNLACGMPLDMLEDYRKRPLKCKSFVGVDFEADYQCLSGEPGTTVNNSAIMESVGVGILSSCLATSTMALERADILSAVTFWQDAFELKLTCDIVEVERDSLQTGLPFVTHCSGWFLRAHPTTYSFKEILTAEIKTYEDFCEFTVDADEPFSYKEYFIFSNLIGRFCAKTGFTMDAGGLSGGVFGEDHDKIILATMQSMLSMTFHVPVVRILVYKVICRYAHLWEENLVQEYGQAQEFAWRKVSSVISRANGATFAMCALRYGCSVDDLVDYERRLFDQPLPILLGGELIAKFLSVDLSP